MRPNLALGPIDSVTQYLLYLSIVVLGVLLPLLVNRWRNQRERRGLVERTIKALDAELSSNRRRVAASHRSLAAMRATLDTYREHRLALRRHLVEPGDPAALPPPPPDTVWEMHVPLVTRTAWDVARFAQALPLLPEARLASYTRAYQMLELFDADRRVLVDAAMQIELLQLPADMQRAETLDAQLRVLSVGLATVRYHEGLAEAMLGAFDAALGRETPAPASTPAKPSPAS